MAPDGNHSHHHGFDWHSKVRVPISQMNRAETIHIEICTKWYHIISGFDYFENRVRFHFSAMQVPQDHTRASIPDPNRSEKQLLGSDKIYKSTWWSCSHAIALGEHVTNSTNPFMVLTLMRTARKGEYGNYNHRFCLKDSWFVPDRSLVSSRWKCLYFNVRMDKVDSVQK